MSVVRYTNSLCPECYRELPAEVSIEEHGVFIAKTCPQHGRFQGILEKDPEFYKSVAGSNNIYDGYLVDVTRRCNTRCSICYFPLEHEDPEGMFSIDNILSDCAANVRLAPFVLTGGEPTMREDITELIDRLKVIGPTEMLTNGIKLADPEFFDELVPHLTRENGVAAFHLSIHPQTRKWINVFGHLKSRGLIAGSGLIVVETKEEFLNALEIIKRCAPLALCFRIKAASRLWNEQKPEDKIFISDMLSWLPGEYRIIREQPNKSVFLNVLWEGIWLMLVSWHDVSNVDLFDIACPPYYRARNGMVANFVTASLVNEGIQKGWCLGQKIATAHSWDVVPIDSANLEVAR